MKKSFCAVLLGTALLCAASCLLFTGCGKEEGELTPITLNEVAHSIFYAPQYAAIELGYFEESLYRAIASEILGYHMNKKTMLLADFLSYVENSTLKDEIYDIIRGIKDEELTETKLRDYIYGVKKQTLENQIRTLKKEQRETIDIYQKEVLGKKIIALKKEQDELKKERSVNND